MNRLLPLACVIIFAGACCLAQQSPPSQAPDRDPEAQESSSRDTRTDISPPKDDAKNHPDSAAATADLNAPPPSDSDVQEFHPWNPMKAMKDIQVGDYYFRRKNYKAALDRYKEALYYKDKDAVATFRLAVCQEKLGDKDEARKYFEQYLKILPEGPNAKEAQASLAKLAKND
jgi:tetratricopeptide (TPR) repeat protein